MQAVRNILPTDADYIAAHIRQVRERQLRLRGEVSQTMQGRREDTVFLKYAGNLKDHVGKKVVVEGTISSTPWQHLMDGPPTHPKSYYFDIGSSQIVVYSKKDINCKGMLKLEGTVIKLGGETRNGRKETATEYHIIVDNCECKE